MQQYGIKNHKNEYNIKGSWACDAVAALFPSAVSAGCSQDQYPQLSEAHRTRRKDMHTARTRVHTCVHTRTCPSVHANGL